jgi:hypothetical protein
LSARQISRSVRPPIDVGVVVRVFRPGIRGHIPPARHTAGHLLPHQVRHVGQLDEVPIGELGADLVSAKLVGHKADAFSVCRRRADSAWSCTAAMAAVATL